MRQARSVLGNFDTYDQANACVRELLRGGLDISAVAIPGQAPKDVRFGSLFAPGAYIPLWARRGVITGASLGFLLDSSLFAPSHVASLDLTGPLAHWLFAIAEWTVAVGGLGVLVGSLLVWSKRRMHLLRYEMTREQDGVLLVVYGTNSAIAEAKRRSIVPVETYNLQSIQEGSV